MMKQDIRSFFDMMLTCYGVWGWELDSQLQLSETNSISPYLYRMLLLGENRSEAILEHSGKLDAPMIVTSSVGLMWALVKDSARENGNIYVLGPVAAGELTSKFLDEQITKYNLDIKTKWELINDIMLIPRVTTAVFFQQSIMLYYYVNGKKIRVSSFVYHTPRQMQTQEKTAKSWDETPHATPMTEKKLLDMVRTGNLEYNAVLDEASAVSPGIRTHGSNPIQRAKYSVVAFITLCSRAAIEGGLSSEVAYTLSDTYTDSVEAAETISQIAVVSHTMFDDYVRRVNQVRRESGITRPVRMCCDYIDTHPDQELQLEFLAARVGYTEYYLARKFKSEMGLSINAYVRRARVNHGKMLLATTNMSIQEIADQMHFCSRSYFAETFRRETGCTPAEYREKQNKSGK